MSKWTEGAEGFICPYCLVSFASSNKLQAHFIDFHSNEGSDAALVLEPDTGNSDESSFVHDQLGHCWKPVSLAKPEKCEACKDIIWSSSLTCQECEMVIHAEKCKDQVTKICTDSSQSSGQFPVPLEERRGSVGGPPPAKGIHGIVKRQVAKGRQRYVDEEFDLDLSYITDRVIAMSFPATGVESAYRNNLKDVAKMLKSRHDDNYMVFNLSERSYDISRFNNQVLDFGWPDHLAPSLERLSIVCKSMKSWLDSDPQHVVVVHCKGGKGRTGCVIAAFMHYSQICQSADDALDHFAMKRFYDDKLQGVTQPSQRRYVHYFEDMLAGKVVLDAPPIKLSNVIIHGIPNFDGKGGCRPFLKVYQNMQLVHTSGLYVCTSDKERIKVSLYGGLKLEGEVLIKCFHKRPHGGVDSIFRCQFHHSIVSEYRLVFSRSELDDSFKDKRFGENIKVEFIFEKCGDKPMRKKEAKLEPDLTDIRHSLLAERTSVDENNRDSYLSFEGGFDHGKPDSYHGDLISFESDQKGRAVSIPMDPELIERVSHEDGDIYTVVTKTNGDASPNEQNKPNPPKQSRRGDIRQIPSQKYSHLVHGPNPKLSSSDKPIPKKPPMKPMRPPITGTGTTYSQLKGKVERKPYDDVKEKHLILTPVTRRESEQDNDMWMAVKWQTLQPETDRKDSISSSQRSSSQTALDELATADMYSNISDFATGNVFVSQQRRHSFTEGDSSIIITSPSQMSHDYSNAIYGNEEIYTIPPDAEGDYSEVTEDDYVNAGAECLEPPSYVNREEVRQEVLEMSNSRPAKIIKRELPPSSVKDMILESLRFKKPDTVTVIQSTSLSQSEKKQTLGMFNFGDTKAKRLQVGRGDYEQFKLDSWNTPTSTKGTRPSPPNRPPNRFPKLTPPNLPPPNLPPPISVAKPTNVPPPTSFHKTHSNDDLSPRDGSQKLPSPHGPGSISDSCLNDSTSNKSKAFIRPHLPLSQVKSQPHVDSNNKPSPPALPVKKPSLHSNNEGVAKPRPNPPPKPAPYQPAKPASVAEVKELRTLWYKPNITRDEAICLVKTMTPGSFIVRDSQTVSGGYALTIKVEKDLVRQRKKLDESFEISDDMCVNHFLIQPDPDGVKLQGWAESSFKSLPEFISRHTAEKMCLPCSLKLPIRDSKPPARRRVDNMSQALVSGAACDLILLGSIDVPSTVGEGVIAEAVQQLCALDLPIMTVVNFKASGNGVTVTDTTNGILNKRNYSLQTISYCGQDPNDTRWDAPLLGDEVRNRPCFGFIHQMQGTHGYSCMLFAELDSQHPVSNVVGYMKRLLKK